MKEILRREGEMAKGRLKMRMAGFIKESGSMIREKDLELSIGVMILFTMEPGRRVNRI